MISPIIQNFKIDFVFLKKLMRIPWFGVLAPKFSVEGEKNNQVPFNSSLFRLFLVPRLKFQLSHTLLA